MLYKITLILFFISLSSILPAGKGYYIFQNSDIRFKFTDHETDLKSIINDVRDSSWDTIGRDLGLTELLGKENFWLRLRIPDSINNKSHLYMFTYIYGLEIYQNGKVIYNYGNLSDSTDYDYLRWHLITLDTLKNGKYILLRIPINYMSMIGNINSISIGEPAALNKIIIESTNEFYYSFTGAIIIGILLSFISFISFLIFIIRIRARDYSFLYFSMFVLCGGLSYLNDCPQVLFYISPITYVLLENISSFLLPVGLLLFIESLFGSGWKRIIRKLWIFHVVFTIFIIVWMFFPLVLEVIDFLYIGSLFIDIVVISIVIFKSRTNSVYNIKPVIYAFVIFSVCGLHDLLALLGLLPWGTIIFGWGLLAVVFAFGYILIKHYMDTYHLVNQYSIELIEKNNEVYKLQKENLQSQFEALKNQINPHFLFNTFSTLISIIEEDPDSAADFVQQLSNVYRYVLLSKDNKTVDLKSEMEFLDSYTFLLSKRFGNNLQVVNCIGRGYYDRQIPPLTMQLLVENAIKHNIISSKKPLVIELNIEDDIYLVIKNNLQKKSIVESSTKIGLQNIINRYAFITDKKVEVINDHLSFIVKVPLLNKQAEE